MEKVLFYITITHTHLELQVTIITKMGAEISGAIAHEFGKKADGGEP